MPQAPALNYMHAAELLAPRQLRWCKLEESLQKQRQPAHAPNSSAHCADVENANAPADCTCGTKGHKQSFPNAGSYQKTTCQSCDQTEKSEVRLAHPKKWRW